MKALFTIVAAGFLASNLSVAGETNSPAPSDDLLIRFAQLRTNVMSAVRVTEEPVRMHDRVAGLCNFILHSRTEPEDPHWKKYAHVYVTPAGAQAMHTSSGSFPRGTIVLKEKYGDASGRNTELFTGMVKHGSGYNPECGDWEFFTLSADAKKVTSRGKLKRCMDCHVEYEKSDLCLQALCSFFSVICL